MQVCCFFAFQCVDIFLFLRHTELPHPIYAISKLVLFSTNNKQLILNRVFLCLSLYQTVQSLNRKGKLFPRPDPWRFPGPQGARHRL